MRHSCRIIISDYGAVLLDLAENPRVAWGGAADHNGVAASLRDHGAGIFGRADIAIADDGNLHGVFNGGDPFPASVPAVSLLAGAGVEGDGGQAAAFCHAG